MTQRPTNPLDTSAPPSPPQGVDRAQTQRAFAALGFGQQPRKITWYDGQVQQASQALDKHPGLSQVMRQAQVSRQCLRLLAPLVQPALLEQLQAGPLLNGEWCILVPHPAWAAKLRQALPAWAAHLRNQGMPIEHIRLQTRVSQPQ